MPFDNSKIMGFVATVDKDGVMGKITAIKNNTLLTVGRLSVNDIVLNDRKVSRQHGSIEIENGNARMRVHATHNGTYVNGMLIKEGTTISIYDGDRITLGLSKLIYMARR